MKMPSICTVVHIFKALSDIVFHRHLVKSVLLFPDEGGEIGEGTCPS